MIPKAIVGGVMYDRDLMMSTAWLLVSLARHDPFPVVISKMEKMPANQAVAEAFGKDQAGKDLLGNAGPAHMGIAVAYTLLAAFESIPFPKLPLNAEGHPIAPTDMAIATLLTSLKFLENFGKPAPEGPTRKVDNDSPKPNDD